MHVIGFVDFVAERNGVSRPQPQQVARGKCASNKAGIVDHTEMADAQAVHAPDRPIDESLRRNGCERPARNITDGLRKRARRVLADRAQNIALGNDAALDTRKRPGVGLLSGRRDEKRTDPGIGHRLQRFFDRSIVRNEERRRRHEFLHAVAIGIGVEPRKHTLGIRTRRRKYRLAPARAVLLFERRG